MFPFTEIQENSSFKTNDKNNDTIPECSLSLKYKNDDTAPEYSLSLKYKNDDTIPISVIFGLTWRDI